MADPLPPGSTIGILGGGQLGRMLALAAARLGLRSHVFEPAPDCPAAAVSARAWTADYANAAALAEFAASVDVMTFEFENVPDAALDAVEGTVPIRPGRRALATSQDRLVEKDFLQSLGLATAPYRAVDTIDDLHDAVAAIGADGILKTRRLGYDGKGQVRVAAGSDLDAAFSELAGAPAILEGFVDFSCEISVIAARAVDGQVAAFDPGENRHQDGILRETRVPARVPARVATDAVLLAGRILNALDYVGVLGIELFVTPAGLIVNEIAPRVHNSGHWTQNACVIDQFEQHIRAIAGWPLGPATRHADAVMENLIGDEVEAWAGVNADGLHLYGKAVARPGRKMGHVNRISPRT